VTKAAISDYSVTHHWTLDETSGIRYDSVSADSVDLGDFNSTSYSTGLLSNAADFESGNSNYLYSLGDEGIGDDEEFIFSLWVKPESIGSNMNLIYTGSGHDGLYSRVNTDGTIFFQFANGSSGTHETKITTNTAISSGSWYHICFDVDTSADDIDVYIDDSLDSATPSQTNANGYDIGSYIYIGTTVSSQYFDGLIDEVSIFSQSNQPSCSDLYNSGTPQEFGSSGGGGASTTNALLLPYNLNMPEILSITCQTATCTVNYATTTSTYLTPVNMAIFIVFFFAVLIFFGTLTFRFL
jgi:hypothetical protein